MNHPRPAVTLIELLIVVAIIAILAAIAVPNFLEAQTRSKVSRAQSDIRAAATAMESYYVDNNSYPPFYARDAVGVIGERGIFFLSTPIAYITSLPADPFQVGRPRTSTNVQKNFMTSFGPTYRYFVYSPNDPFVRWDRTGWSLRSMGPDQDWDLVGHAPDNENPPLNGEYDPTNGTVSNGDLLRFGGGAAGIP